MSFAQDYREFFHNFLPGVAIVFFVMLTFARPRAGCRDRFRTGLEKNRVPVFARRRLNFHYGSRWRACGDWGVRGFGGAGVCSKVGHVEIVLKTRKALPCDWGKARICGLGKGPTCGHVEIVLKKGTAPLFG